MAIVRYVDDIVMSPSVSPKSNPNESQRIAQMRTKNARLLTANDNLTQARPMVEQMVKGEEYLSGSKMIAYNKVSREIGKSPSWVRKLIGRQTVSLQHFEFLNIARAYDYLCARFDEAAATERARAEYMRREIDEALDRRDDLVGRFPPAPRD